MSTARTHGLHCLRQQPQERSTDQGSGREAHEVRQHAQPGLFRQEQEQPGEGGARNATDRGEQDDPGEKGQDRYRFFVTPSRSLYHACHVVRPGPGSIQISAAIRPH